LPCRYSTTTTSPTATISSTASCTAPCNVSVTFSSANVASYPNVVQIYKDGVSLWTETGNISKTNTDWSVAAGSHTYCIRADNADWSITRQFGLFDYERNFGCRDTDLPRWNSDQLRWQFALSIFDYHHLSHRYHLEHRLLHRAM